MKFAPDFLEVELDSADTINYITPNYNGSLKVFAINDSEYCSLCGAWYTSGDTAYIEPVVTHPEYRKQGLAKAVVYEAMKRAKSLGAKRAIVISDQAFYHNIGFETSSNVAIYKRIAQTSQDK